jgi:FKBP12-rapamycin complex-associated protein
MKSGRSDPASLFQQALSISKGIELERQLLHGALDSDDWLDRRLNYTTSLAFTSIVGYLLGLVRRDPDMVVMELPTARLFHVQLENCFEQHKEAVPFRLTRLLVNALEVSKIEGTFRTCTEDIMTLMKQNIEELAILLEVFVDDPLYQWSPGLPQDFMVTGLKEKCQSDRSVTAELLINATSPQNLSKMPFSWAPWL